MKLLNIFILSLVFVSCASRNDGPEHCEKCVQGYGEEVKVAIQNQLGQSTNERNTELLEEIYSAIGNVPIWLDVDLQFNEEGEKIKDLLRHSMYYGLDTNRYFINLEQDKLNHFGDLSLEEKAGIDISLSSDYLKFAKDLNFGVVDTSLYQPEFGKKEFKIDLKKLFIEQYKEGKLIDTLLSLQPNIPEYIALQRGLENFLKERKLTDSSITIEKYTKQHTVEDSLKIYNKAREILVMHDYIDSMEVDDSTFIRGLKSFQVNHGLKPDAMIGKNTAHALSGNPMEFYRRAAVSLEKWRWVEPDSLEEEYIFANIATYKLKFYQNQKLVRQHRVVVGAYLTQTPELDSEIEYMIAYPFWTVPYSIKTKELIPKSKKDSTYLQRNNYQLLKGGEVVDMANVNWKDINIDNFNYTVRQKGGRSNALGVIKFIFPNPHQVYFHDTPSKGNFENDIRAYSHGCIRVDEPLDMAAFLLSRDSETFSMDSVKATINRKQRKTITLKKNMPVHIRYYTAEGDADGNVLFYPDVYGREKNLESIMFNTEI